MISGLTLNRTLWRWPIPLLMYRRRLPDNSNSPHVQIPAAAPNPSAAAEALMNRRRVIIGPIEKLKRPGTALRTGRGLFPCRAHVHAVSALPRPAGLPRPASDSVHASPPIRALRNPRSKVRLGRNRGSRGSQDNRRLRGPSPRADLASAPGSMSSSAVAWIPLANVPGQARRTNSVRSTQRRPPGVA